MEGLDPTQWGPQQTEGPETFRVARGGKTAVWKVPVWWGGSFRPPRGTVFVLSVRYRDTISAPAVFSAHAGLAPYWRHSEIHRFGGQADGNWKTAPIPLSWDLICRIRGEDNTAFSIRSPGDLPVGKVGVRLAGAGDAERFHRECREQVARQDADLVARVAPIATEMPVIPEGLRAKAVIPFSRPYYVPVHQHSAPAAGEAAATVRLRMTLDEYEPAAFGVYANGRDLKNVTCELSELIGPHGKLRGNAELRTVEYAVVEARSGKDTVLRYVPLRLWPSFPVDIPAGRSHGFWLTVRTEGDRSRPGLYTGTVTIRSGQESAELPVEVDVLPLRLLTVDEAGVQMGACVNALPPEQEMQTFQEHNLRVAQSRFHSTNLPLVAAEDGDEIDFGYLDEWMDMAKAHGLACFRYLLGGNPYGYPATMTFEKALFARAHGQQGGEAEFVARHKPYREKPDSAGVLAELRPLYQLWVRQMARHARQKDWPKIVLEPFDEPAKWVQSFVFPDSPEGCLGAGPWIKRHFKDGARLIREATGDVLVGVTVHHAEPGMPFLADADLVSTNAIHEDLTLGEKIREAGRIFWQYTGCNATQPAGIPRYTCGFYFGAFQSIGGVTWAMNWKTGFEHYGNVSWAYSWYTPFGTITSPAYEGLREGLEDRRLIETCRRQFRGHPEAERLLATILEEAVAARAKGGEDTVTDFYNSPREVAKLDAWRNRLLDELLKMQEQR
jgi:hypothetical protein